MDSMSMRWCEGVVSRWCYFRICAPVCMGVVFFSPRLGLPFLVLWDQTVGLLFMDCGLPIPLSTRPSPSWTRTPMAFKGSHRRRVPAFVYNTSFTL